MARVRNLPKSRSAVYLGRARQHERQMAVALEHHRWDAVGLCAVHLTIASVDAVTCAKLGQVWSGEDHGGVVDLLRETGVAGVDVASRQVASILESKTRVEYGAEAASAPRATEMGKQAKRVFDWAVSALRSEEADRAPGP
ncbi:MAG: hypothetical protein L3K00_04335 [Thermoplasmata archaeon]|nr:hypothetical protein [Thermoplasmata archaeon]MCI4361850.1 hypothetical protein [Thermoplasmata archaeon]